MARDFFLDVWLVPSNQILEQTYDALSDTHHPNRKALNQYFNDSVESTAANYRESTFLFVIPA